MHLSPPLPREFSRVPLQQSFSRTSRHRPITIGATSPRIHEPASVPSPEGRWRGQRAPLQHEGAGTLNDAVIGGSATRRSVFYREKQTMRLTLAVLVLAAGFVAAPGTASAQSPYSYPWCAKIFLRGTPTSCYYTSQQLCMATVSGNGGYCYLNPAYRGAAVSPRHYRYRRV
jgi:hypothetical protein